MNPNYELSADPAWLKFHNYLLLEENKGLAKKLDALIDMHVKLLDKAIEQRKKLKIEYDESIYSKQNSRNQRA